MEMKETNLKYTAIKVKSMNHWLWFKTGNIEINSYGEFTGSSGWGKNGAQTDITIKTTDIEGYLYSDTLQQ